MAQCVLSVLGWFTELWPLTAGSNTVRVESVGSAAASQARSVLMETWRMTMTQRIQKDTHDRISGRAPVERERKVEPAVRVEISKEARKIDEHKS